jgi:hypothetical protein
MGGSVLYNPEAPSSGQLVKGAHVAVRLGYVEAELAGNDQYIYTDIQEKAQYGTLQVIKINKEMLTFDWKAYSRQEALAAARYTITLNDSVDINGDGIADLAYAPPVRKRPGFENAVYLTFLSSQEKLNTSMFAVLQNQYSRSVYPSGIIGINPDGKFIISKYESNSSNRSLVMGAQKGDFVVDSLEGKYQRVSSVSVARSARAISDAELEDIETSVTISYYFTESEFIGYDAENLFLALPALIQETSRSSDSWVEKLNHILKNRDLIIVVAQTGATPIPADIFSSVVDQISSLTDDEVVQLNRKFLQETYPELCPEFVNPNDGFVEIIPLASLVLGDLDDFEQVDIQDATRAVSASEYETQRKNIDNRFEGYNKVFSQNLTIADLAAILKIDTKGFNMSFKESFLKVGVKGAFLNTWGVGASIEGVVYINADMNTDITTSFTKTLKDKKFFSYEKEIKIPVLSYGPITLKITAGTGAAIPLTIEVTTPVECKGRFAFTGLYGAGVKAEVKAGIGWKKVWFVRIPVLDIQKRGDKRKIEQTAYYIGANPSYSVGFKDASISVSPNLYAFIGMDLCEIVTGKIKAETGIEEKLALVYELLSNIPYLTARATTTAYAKLTADVAIGYKFPVIGFLGYSNSFILAEPLKKKLYEAVVYQKKI